MAVVSYRGQYDRLMGGNPPFSFRDTSSSAKRLRPPYIGIPPYPDRCVGGPPPTVIAIEIVILIGIPFFGVDPGVKTGSTPLR